MKNTVLKYHYEKDLWNANKSVQNKINEYLKREEIKNNRSRQGLGNIITTVDDSEDWLLNIEEIAGVLNWIEAKILESAKIFYETEKNKIEQNRIWLNKMQFDSSVKWHRHVFDGIVGVFYLNVPENGAKFLTEETEILVKTGDLLIHRSDLKHAVSRHTVEEPRVSLIYEGIFE